MTQIQRKVFFEMFDGQRVFCSLSEPSTSQKKMVIMSHGFRGTSVGPARTFVDFENILLADGYSVLRYDQIGCGNSDGDFLHVSYTQWVSTLVFLTQKYLHLGYQIALLGHSMGGSATVVATAQPQLKDKIPCIILWAPGVNDSEFVTDAETMYEEAGQKYYGKFWNESRGSDFFARLGEYAGGIYLVYGENDKYMKEELRNKVIAVIQEKGEEYTILKGQDHASWQYDVSQEVYVSALRKLQSCFK